MGEVWEIAVKKNNLNANYEAFERVMEDYRKEHKQKWSQAEVKAEIVAEQIADLTKRHRIVSLDLNL